MLHNGVRTEGGWEKAAAKCRTLGRARVEATVSGHRMVLGPCQRTLGDLGAASSLLSDRPQGLRLEQRTLRP